MAVNGSQALTKKYYSSILLKFINKKHYTEVWNELVSLSPKNQTLEKGAIFTTHWCKENDRGITEAVTADLDYTADLAKRYLLQQEPDHPLKNVRDETLQIWKNENIPDNMFKPQDCKSILAAISHILFEHLNYRISRGFIASDKKRFGIDCAVADRKATPLVFAVIYESISRRLGVKLEILEFVDHCLLKWKENYRQENSPYHYISMSSENLFIKTGRCPSMHNTGLVVPPCNMINIAQRTAFTSYEAEEGGDPINVRDALELLLVINPFNREWYLQYCECLMVHEMDVRDIISKLPILSSQMPEHEWGFFLPLLNLLKKWERQHGAFNDVSVVHRRGPGIDFAVGMIVRNKVFDSVGVICGWDGESHLNASNTSEPLYKVLVADGSCQYWGQENLQILHSPPFVSNPSIGRYFEEHCTTYYQPNRQLQFEYPEDMEALLNILKKDREI